MAATDSAKISFRIPVVLATALAMIGLAGGACAQTGPGPVDLRVVDRDTGQVLQTWRSQGRLFVAGRPGDRYSLRVTNHTDGRVLVVMSVDGVNILSGQTAGYDQRGYVFDPYESYDVSGWRKSDTEVAAFSFAPLSQSYAARTGRPTDVGVIGMAVFREKVAPPPPEPEPTPQAMDSFESNSPRGRFSNGAPVEHPMPAPPASAIPPTGGSAAKTFADRSAPALRDEKLGTAHGAREWSVVNTVSFERATTYPAFTRQIEYDTYAHLVAAGVIPRWREPEPHPRAFPSHPDEQGYVPDPPYDR